MPAQSGHTGRACGVIPISPWGCQVTMVNRSMTAWHNETFRCKRHLGVQTDTASVTGHFLPAEFLQR
ncbi:hypothetical protein RI509_11120 [Levilactobacillus namurensis]|nr:hypothetical protein [Levilactobacillus namurensis]